ncbi:hypothetical protein [Lyngbya confervoides]|uniref:Uncharacterized protein n=1 Tax=Lyngbya confervoides BDU141951 TaxID=1574623 RepID=A0ABD4T1U5_9CYAN|nr:hypothetical protein [Lyngbya confervoides]MCM1982731.1 hypothetical protein [Lyngbya confervoides BDU141951]
MISTPHLWHEWGKPVMNMRNSLNSALLSVLIGGGTALLVTQVYFSFLLNPSISQPRLKQSDSPGSSVIRQPREPGSSTLPPDPLAPAGKDWSGDLRVFNQTLQPIRLVLRRSPRTPADQSAELPPVEWDFTGQEGADWGVTVSLPNQSPMDLKPGDVLFAYALDSSHRYWGPFVVGQTEAPVHDPAKREWRLRIQERRSPSP